MDYILPTEILCKILLSVVSPPTLFINFSDKRHKYTDEDIATCEDISDLPTFEAPQIGLTHELSFFHWPVDFRHTMPAYRAHQLNARNGILTCKTFKEILTPILYQCIVVATSTQARALVATLEDAKLANLVEIVIVCPAPLKYPNMALVNRVVTACPELRAFHNLSIYHSVSPAAHASAELAVLPLSTKVTRLSHDPTSVFQIQNLPAMCDTLVFLELVSPACHWDGAIPALQVTLPNLVSLKMEQRTETLTMMQDCFMPALRHMSLTRPLRRADVGMGVAAFFQEHGRQLLQLEYTGALWSMDGGDAALEGVCPDLRELILDPMCCIGMVGGEEPPLIRGAPGHRGVSRIGLRNISSSIGQHEDDSDELNRNLGSLINAEAFPALGYVCDMAWRGSAPRGGPGWGLIIDLCASGGVQFNDWMGSTVV